LNVGAGITVTILLANYLGDFLARMADPHRLTKPRDRRSKETTALMAGDE
jgi:hypothetical protein